MVPVDYGELKKKYSQTKRIYSLIIGSVFVYAFVVELIKKNSNFMSNAQPEFEFNAFRYILYTLCIVTFFVIRFLRKYMLSKPEQSSLKYVMTQSNKLATIDIITAALCETVAIYGLVLFFIGKRIDDFYILLMLSLLYFAIYFPRYSAWEEWVRKNAPEDRK